MSKWIDTDELDYVSAGLCPGCEVCADESGLKMKKFNRKVKSGRLSDEGEFSWSRCEGCGSSLGGMRYAAHGFCGDELVHFEICVDCLMAMA